MYFYNFNKDLKKKETWKKFTREMNEISLKNNFRRMT